jgi:hypothetical protein
MMEVQDEIADVLTGEPSNDAPDDRLSGDGNGRLRPYACQWPEPRAEARCEDERVRDHSGALLGVEEHVRP